MTTARTFRALALLAVLASAAPLVGSADAKRLPPDPIGRARVVDGDTLDVGGTRVRLFGIDAPEHHQFCTIAGGHDWACGDVATRQLRRMVEGRTLRCRARDRDRYGRTVALCYAGRQDIGAAMVRAGLAVAFTRDSRRYVTAERQARAQSRGLWAGEFTRPEEWRENHRSSR